MSKSWFVTCQGYSEISAMNAKVLRIVLQLLNWYVSPPPPPVNTKPRLLSELKLIYMEHSSRVGRVLLIPWYLVNPIQHKANCYETELRLTQTSHPNQPFNVGAVSEPQMLPFPGAPNLACFSSYPTYPERFSLFPGLHLWSKHNVLPYSYLLWYRSLGCLTHFWMPSGYLCLHITYVQAAQTCTHFFLPPAIHLLLVCES